MLSKEKQFDVETESIKRDSHILALINALDTDPFLTEERKSSWRYGLGYSNLFRYTRTESPRDFLSLSSFLFLSDAYNNDIIGYYGTCVAVSKQSLNHTSTTSPRTWSKLSSDSSEGSYANFVSAKRVSVSIRIILIGEGPLRASNYQSLKRLLRIPYAHTFE